MQISLRKNVTAVAMQAASAVRSRDSSTRFSSSLTRTTLAAVAVTATRSDNYKLTDQVNNSHKAQQPAKAGCCAFRGEGSAQSAQS